MRAIFLLIVVATALFGASYAAAKFTAGEVVGADHPGLGRSSTHFAFDGIRSLKNHPRGWIVAYPSARDLGPGGAEIYVSPTGSLLGTRPGDLRRRIDEARRIRDEP
jgi:hypothetical protein